MERAMYVLLLWARTHGDDFTSVGSSAHGYPASGTRLENLRRFVKDTRSVLEEAAEEGGGTAGGAPSGGHGEICRYLEALDSLLESNLGRVGSRSYGGKRRASSTATCSRRDSGHAYDGSGGGGIDGTVGGAPSAMATSPASDDVGAVRERGRSRAMTASSAAGSASRGGRGRSLSSGSHEFGVNYWKRLLESPSSHEKSFIRELAEQLTVHEASLLSGVRPCELQGLAFAKSTKAERSPNVLMLISHFNRVSRWITTQVVKQPTVRERARCLRLFIDLANACRDLSNFNAVMEIVAALNSSALFRLKRTWDALPKSSRKDWEELGELVHPVKSHAALRQAMRQTGRRAAVPYLGLYLTDLTFIEDGNKDWVADDDMGGGARLVNLGKCMMLGKVHSEIVRFQNTMYDIEPIEPMALFFSALDPPDDDAIYALSLACEPREGESKVEMVTSPSLLRHGGGAKAEAPAASSGVSSSDGGVWRPGPPPMTRQGSSASSFRGASTIPKVSPRQVLKKGITATLAAKRFGGEAISRAGGLAGSTR
mmetsp:Transcript_2298/g.4760  ORF Transcript_2298/g.4760 Transcript_2298/m.4760 type:complete len:541 (-) Transcript_2298:518-2140(-)